MTNHDRLFKELLTTFFSVFIKTFLPDVAAYLDLDTVVFLEKELIIAPDKLNDVYKGRIEAAQ